ncbi:MAG: molybdopterin-guanine dinucleotide biosynthesis protein A [Gemmatimonadetes bacterium]|nr:molybdopterin-guanine dinucleotide biosynthesis protein A [Gemmatimonadota bacterium]
MQVGGVVLCGGESKRMGRSKALLPFGRETMLQRVASVLEKELAPIVIVAAPGQELPELGSDILEVRDEVPGQGPVQALLTGLNVLDESVHCAFVCSCDLPLLTTDFVKFIVDRASPDSIVVPEIEGRKQPLCAVYPRRVRSSLMRMVEDSCFRLTNLTKRFPTTLLPEEQFRGLDPDLRSFTNVNSEATYNQAIVLAGI